MRYPVAPVDANQFNVELSFVVNPCSDRLTLPAHFKWQPLSMLLMMFAPRLRRCSCRRLISNAPLGVNSTHVFTIECSPIDGQIRHSNPRRSFGALLLARRTDGAGFDF